MSKIDNYKPGRWFKAKSIDEMEAFFWSRLPAIREAAKEHGYAIGVHGSARRDFDLIATQWRDGASDKDVLAKAIHMAACGLHSSLYQWEEKPVGRVATAFPILWTGDIPNCPKISAGHVDLSVVCAENPTPADIAVEVCDRCNGTGKWGWSEAPDLYDCDDCTRQQEQADGECEDCHGTGEVFTHSMDCYDDLCALNGDEHSCTGVVVPCSCAPVAAPETDAGEALCLLGDSSSLPDTERNSLETIIRRALAEKAVPDRESGLDCRPDKTGLDDGPDLPLAVVNAGKKPMVVRAWQEGLSARACARIFDISHETAAQWTKGLSAPQLGTKGE